MLLRMFIKFVVTGLCISLTPLKANINFNSECEQAVRNIGLPRRWMNYENPDQPLNNVQKQVEERLFLIQLSNETGGGKEERNNKIMTDYIKVSNRTFPEYEDYDDPVVSVLMETFPIYSCLGQNTKQLVHTIRDEIDSWDGSEYSLSMPPSEFLSQPRSFHDLQAVEVDTLIFKGKKKGGFFIEAGAYDFEYESTSLYFELLHDWTGLLVEPSQIYYQVGRAKNRKVKSVNCCLSPKQRPTTMKLIGDSILVVPSTQALIELDVQCFPLYSILLALDNPTVNYFSLDIEGGEYQVLETIPWDKVDIEVMSIETHFMGLRSKETKSDLILYLDRQGYTHMPGAHKSSGQTFEYETEDGKTALHDIENDLFVRKDIVKKYNVDV